MLASERPKEKWRVFIADFAAPTVLQPQGHNKPITTTHSLTPAKGRRNQHDFGPL